MNSSKSSESQCTERECLSSQVLIWTAAGVSILFLSACFISKCVVTYHMSQMCHEKNFQSHGNAGAFSCYNNESESVQNCCPSNWKQFQFSCYFFSTDTIPWSTSSQNCSGMGAHLVIINSLEEQEFLHHAKPRSREFYIGLTDQVVEGQWKWVDGTPLTESLSFWDVGEPNNKVTLEDCATIRDSPNPRKNWNDLACFLSVFRICEILSLSPLNSGTSFAVHSLRRTNQVSPGFVSMAQLGPESNN
ncbi:C-type lectin domain family 4 member E [Carlito syrichta]|uniref:C-type lectin domain family 4 member E n=1 Tax=Carlito syrichta TaxID=1868482 RepID=A0A1U7T5W9_CARSF|nr:C-type lectin domain family 4 member E [Carlito syrichta]